MQFDRKELLAALRTIGAIIPKRVTMPILGCVEISHKGYVRGTNIDQYIEIDVRQWAGAPTTRNLCTPVHALIKILSAMTEHLVWFDYDHRDDKWTVAKLELEHLDGRDLPEAQAMLESAVEHAVPAADLVLMLDKCYFAASKDGGTGILNSISWKGASVAATDGSRLSHLELLDHGMDVLIDSELLADVGRLLKRETGDVLVTTYGGNTRIKAEKWCTWMRNISGVYPRYEELFPRPEDYKAKLVFKRDEMLAKLKHVAVRLDKRTNKIVIDCEANEIWCEDEEGLRAAMFTGIDTTCEVPPFAVNYHYWKQAVESMGEEVTIDFQAALKPLVFRDGNYKHLLMPIQVAKPAKVVKEPKPPKAPKNKAKGKHVKEAEVTPKKPSGVQSGYVDASDVSADVASSVVAEKKFAPAVVTTQPGVEMSCESQTAADVAPIVTAGAGFSRPANSPCYHASRTCKAIPCALTPAQQVAS